MLKLWERNNSVNEPHFRKLNSNDLVPGFEDGGAVITGAVLTVDLGRRAR